MHAMLRAIALTAAVAGVISCSARPHVSTWAQNEYGWALDHGACDCNPIAFAPGSAAPSWTPGLNLTAYVHDKFTYCGSRDFIVAAFGDGESDLVGDMNLARARAAPFVRRLRRFAHRRVDTLLLAGPRILHASTLVIMCPTSRLPA